MLTLTWNYSSSPPVVTDSCVPVTGELIQGSGTNTATATYFPEIGFTTFEITGGAGGSSLTGGGAPGGADVVFVTVDVQPGEVFGYVSACTGELAIGGAGFAQGGSSGNVLSTSLTPPQAWDAWAGCGTNCSQTYYVGETDTGGEGGGGGGASALCAGAGCNPNTPLCSGTEPVVWTGTTDCVIAVAGGGAGAGVPTTFQNARDSASLLGHCSYRWRRSGLDTSNFDRRLPGTYAGGSLTPGQNGSDPTLSTGASGGDNGTGLFLPTVAFSTANDQGNNSTFATTVNGASVFGTAGGGGGYEGGQAGQSLSECAGGGGSAWWFNNTGTDAVTGTMDSPTTGSPQLNTGMGSVTIQGFSNNVTAARSSSVGSTSW